jgi:hypothetical protein
MGYHQLMMTITRVATNVGNQLRMQGSNGKRGYIGAGLLGTVCESNILRHITGNQAAKAPTDWPMGGRLFNPNPRRFEEEVALINAENPGF